MNSLYRFSIDLIRQHQHPSGAYIASPNFPTYHYCWFRDGSFIAYGMDRAGEHESAHRFHEWAAQAVLRRDGVVDLALERVSGGQPLQPECILRTRYSLDGGEEPDEEWPNFQLDGFGTWLWAAGEHRKLGGQPLSETICRAAGVVARYLTALWKQPCFDCWEEFGDRTHPYTLAAIYGGLKAHQELAGVDHTQTLDAIREFVLAQGVRDGRLVKSIGSPTVDASLLGLATPYRLLEPGDPLAVETRRWIRRLLAPYGGVRRYPTDTYYGGGEWLLLTAWLGWQSVETGDRETAQLCKQWIEDQADEQGYLPEQATTHPIDECYLPHWERLWGPVAKPLLWSHAMYLILCLELGEGE